MNPIRFSPIYEYSGILTLGLEVCNLPENSFVEICVGFQRATSLLNQQNVKDHFSYLIRNEKSIVFKIFSSDPVLDEKVLLGQATMDIASLDPTSWCEKMATAQINDSSLNVWLRFAPLRLSPEVLNDQPNIVFDSFGFDIEDYGYTEKVVLDALSRASIIHMDRPELRLSPTNVAQEGIGFAYKVYCWEYYAKLIVHVPDELYAPNLYADSVKTPPNNVKNYENILVDVPRTFPRHPAFGGKGREEIKKVLMALTIWNPSLGYCQSMNNIVAILLLIVDQEVAFRLAVILIHYITPDYYSNNMVGLQVDQLVISKLIELHLPVLGQHFAKLKVDPFIFVTGWMMNLFSASFPLPTVYRIWDFLFCEGGSGTVRVVIAILKLHEKLLLNLKDFMTMMSSMNRENMLLYDWSELVSLIVHGPTKNEVENLRKNLFNVVVERHQERELKRIRETNVPYSFFASLKDKLYEAYGDYRITKELFMSIYSVFIVDYDENKEVTDHLFSIFQLEDESHVFDFRELFVCMAPSLRGTLDEKIRFLFEIFDLKKTGFIQREDLRDLIKYNYKSQFLQLSNEKLEVLLCLAWRRTLVDSDNGLSLSDFIYLCETQPFTIMI